MDRLRANGIFWGWEGGDINSGNVVVDEKLDAWVAEFGWQNNAAFVGDGWAETKESDLQGVRRLLGEWLPGRRRDVHISASVF